LENSRNALGYETFDHWKFFEANDAAKIIEYNLDSFMDLVFANDTSLWRYHFVIVGKLREWLNNNNQTKRASYITQEDYNILKQYFIEGMQPKINWFRIMIGMMKKILIQLSKDLCYISEELKIMLVLLHPMEDLINMFKI
jgi:hypothetical protein